MTDEELRKEILQRVYNKKARYVVRDITGEIYAYGEKPKFDNGGYWWGEGDIVIELTYFDDLFPDLHMSIETLLDIGKELEIVNWEQVKRDTQVIVSNDLSTWHNRYFSNICRMKNLNIGHMPKAKQVGALKIFQNFGSIVN